MWRRYEVNERYLNDVFVEQFIWWLVFMILDLMSDRLNIGLFVDYWTIIDINW